MPENLKKFHSFKFCTYLLVYTQLLYSQGRIRIRPDPQPCSTYTDPLNFRDAKRKLAKSAPKRESISTESKYEKQGRLKKAEMVAASKKRKLKLKQSDSALEPSPKKGRIHDGEHSSPEKKEKKRRLEMGESGENIHTLKEKKAELGEGLAKKRKKKNKNAGRGVLPSEKIETGVKNRKDKRLK